MLPLSSVAAVILCLGLSALGAQEALDCIETENKQINKTKGERWTKRGGGGGDMGYKRAPPSVGSRQTLSWKDSTHRRSATHSALSAEL